MSEDDDSVLFEPDPSFASGWFVNDGLAQGGLKHASIVVLDEIMHAQEEANRPAPDFGDFSPLGIFPDPIRPVLTPWLIEKIHTAALIVGWKLAQPGSPIPPGCIAEELALELIRDQADASLDLSNAPPASIDATKGVYRVCFHGDLFEYFRHQRTSDVALAARYSIRAVGDSEARLSKWFRPFFPGQIGGAVHPWFYEEPRGPVKRDKPSDLQPVDPVEPSEMPRPNEKLFRVSVRIWDDDLMDRESYSRMPFEQLFYLEAPTADAAREDAIRRTAEGESESSEPAMEDRIDRPDVSRLSIDVQRVGLPQDFKEGNSFHILGSLAPELPREHLPSLAGYLDAKFPRAILATKEGEIFFAVSLHAENHEEAAADLEDALAAFMDGIGFEEFPIDSSSSKPGGRGLADLWRDLLDYDWRRRGV
jgi:hypothetical protein